MDHRRAWLRRRHDRHDGGDTAECRRYSHGRGTLDSQGDFHNPFLAFENGEDFLKVFHRAAEGKLSPFILVMEGSIPDEKNKAEGYWASFGTDQKTGSPS